MGKSGRLRDERVGRVEHRLERLARDVVLRARVAGRAFLHRAGRVDEDRDRRAEPFLDFGLVGGVGRRRLAGRDRPGGLVALTPGAPVAREQHRRKEASHGQSGPGRANRGPSHRSQKRSVPSGSHGIKLMPEKAWEGL